MAGVGGGSQGAHGTTLDYTMMNKPGYYAGSVWPVECGGSRRQKLVGSRGLGIRPHEVGIARCPGDSDPPPLPFLAHGHSMTDLPLALLAVTQPLQWMH